MLTKKRKIIILAGMVALLAVTAVLNIWLLGGQPEEPEYMDTASFFTSFRMERENTRTQELLYLQSIIETEGEEFAAARASAMEQQAKLLEVMDKEMTLEQLIIAKGFDDAVVSIGVNSDSINIIVMCDELTLNDTILIYNAVKEVLGTADVVKIFNV